MAQETISDLVTRSVREGLRKGIDGAKEQIIKDAVKAFEEQVRRVVALTAIELVNVFSVERMGQDLLIRVKIDTSEEKNGNR